MSKPEETIICKNGHENPPDAEFCGECRMPLERDTGLYGLHRLRFFLWQRAFTTSSILLLLLVIFFTYMWREYLGAPSKDVPLQSKIIVSLLIISFTTLLLWGGLRHYLRPKTFAEKKNFILMIAQITGGVVLLTGLFFTWQNIKSAQEAKQEAKIEILTQTQRQERYLETVNQLNNQTSVTGRVNAIDNLGKLASDPDFDEYYGRIINTLVTFIRENSKLKKNENVQQDEKISDDVQAALKVLGWRKHKWGDGEESQRLDLSDTRLREVDLDPGKASEGAHLEGVIFINADLDHAMLREANLENAILNGANLRYAILYKANLQDADLLGANLEGADLQYAKGLTVEQIKAAKNWDKAIFSPQLEKELRATN